MKTGLFGGTFDPIHNGHMKIARELINKNILDRVIFVVAYAPPHKDKKITNETHRLNMVKIAAGDDFYVSDYEIKKGGKSYSYDTLTYFSQLCKDDEIFFITGADMLLSLPNWYKADELLKNFSFIGVDRNNQLEDGKITLVNEIIKKYDAKIILTDIKTPSISSTEVRQMLKNGEDVSMYINENVLKYIKDNKLYE